MTATITLPDCSIDKRVRLEIVSAGGGEVRTYEADLHGRVTFDYDPTQLYNGHRLDTGVWFPIEIPLVPRTGS